MKKHIYLNILIGIILSALFTAMTGAMLAYVLRHRDDRALLLSVVLSLIFLILLYLFSWKKIKSYFASMGSFPDQWREILSRRVSFYRSLTQEDREFFEKQVLSFLSEVHITGIGVHADIETRLLVAASAVIPVLRFPGWSYSSVLEVLVYPGNFDENFNFKKSAERTIMGMVVGNTSTVILSKPALFDGFTSDSDGYNTGIHEFVHKIDQEDGLIDGVPSLLLNKKDRKIWRKIIEEESKLIENGQSDINPYALTNAAEFFAVASEYFFERPEHMARDHKKLYSFMKKIFRQNLVSQMKKTLHRAVPSRKLGRNAPCHCVSGKKYKKCCLYKDIEDGNNN